MSNGKHKQRRVELHLKQRFYISYDSYETKIIARPLWGAQVRGEQIPNPGQASSN